MMRATPLSLLVLLAGCSMPEKNERQVIMLGVEAQIAEGMVWDPSTSLRITKSGESGYGQSENGWWKANQIGTNICWVPVNSSCEVQVFLEEQKNQSVLNLDGVYLRHPIGPRPVKVEKVPIPAPIRFEMHDPRSEVGGRVGGIIARTSDGRVHSIFQDDPKIISFLMSPEMAGEELDLYIFPRGGIEGPVLRYCVSAHQEGWRAQFLGRNSNIQSFADIKSIGSEGEFEEICPVDVVINFGRCEVYPLGQEIDFHLIVANEQFFGETLWARELGAVDSSRNGNAIFRGISIPVDLLGEDLYLRGRSQDGINHFLFQPTDRIGYGQLDEGRIEFSCLETRVIVGIDGKEERTVSLVPKGPLGRWWPNFKMEIRKVRSSIKIFGLPLGDYSFYGRNGGDFQQPTPVTSDTLITALPRNRNL